MSRFGDVQVVFRKELLETVRDYKNILVMAFIPVVFLQVMIAATQSMVEHSIGQIQKQKITIAVYGDDAHGFLRKMIAVADNSIVFVEPVGERPDEGVAAGQFDMAVVSPPGFAQNIAGCGEPQSVELVYDARHQNALFAFAKVHNVLNALKQHLKEKRIESAGLVLPKELSISYVMEGKQIPRGVRNIAVILPGLLLLVVLIALLSPSMDLFTGENERGTMPLLMVSPVETKDIVLGKLAVVCLFGMTAATLGLLSFFVTVNVFGRRGDAYISFAGIAPESMLFLFLLMAPLVILLASLGVLLASKCKTFQQGQGYYLPFMIAAICPAFVLELNDASLSSFVSFLPIGNVCLAMKEVLLHNYQWNWLALTFLIASVYAGFAVYKTIHLFDRTEQLERDSLPRHVRWRRGDYLPEVGLLLAVSFLLMFYAGQILQTWQPLLGMVFSQLLGVLLPALLALRLVGLPIQNTLSFSKPSWQSLIGVVLLSPATAAISIGVSQIQSQFMPIPESFARAFLEMIMPAGRSLSIAILVFAILPALCEEILFRGAVLGLLRKKLSLKASIILVGILFGAFHLSTYRFLGTAILGIILSSIVAIGGSIFPAMLLHGCHNALLIVAQVNHWDHPTLLQIIGLGAMSLIGAILLLSDLRAKLKASRVK